MKAHLALFLAIILVPAITAANEQEDTKIFNEMSKPTTVVTIIKP